MTAPRLQILEGKKLVRVEAARVDELCAAAERVLIDVGTGDARTAYRVAKANPAWLVIGVDPAWQRMVPTAVRAARKEAKGGAPNLLLVNSSIETVPDVLRERADEVTALMPWGKLLRGIVLGDADVCLGLRAAAKSGAPLDIAIGTSIWRDPVPIGLRDLPELTVEYAETVLADRFAHSGWTISEARLVPHTELDQPAAGGGAGSGSSAGVNSSSWARRLGSGTTETVIHLRAVAGQVPDPVDPRAPMRTE